MIMNWNLCERNFIRIVERDDVRIESIVAKVLLRLKRAEGSKVSEETVSFIVEDYYESIKELLVAYMLKGGMRSKNHQCLISYFLKKNPDKEDEAKLIQQMSYFRNRLGYYGEGIPMKFYEVNRGEFKKIIKFLLELLREVKKNG